MVDFHLLSEGDTEIGTQKVLVYIANGANPSFAGTTDSVETIAQQICTSEGKSGKNTDYIFRLAEAFRLLYPKIEDQHLFELEKEVKRQISIK